jgi:DNA-directed RNA polymerase sigma subunit (sigma70/sigma32)
VRRCGGRRGLVGAGVKRFLNKGVDASDLAADATQALVTAAERYSPDRGSRFSTYAFMVLQAELTRVLVRHGSVIYLPFNVVELRWKIARAERDLSQELKRTPSAEELAARYPLPPIRFF